MKVAILSAFTLLLAACPSPLGQPCESAGRCAGGFTCVVDTTTTPYSAVCARSCVHNRDCGSGVDCRVTNNPSYGDGGFCNDFGILGSGDRCSDWGELRGCGPGLACARYTQTCVPACDIDSTLLAERMCPSGMACNAAERTYYDNMRAVSPWGYCRTQCDPSMTDSCGRDFVCRRWLSPGIGEVATCEIMEFERVCFNGTSCPSGQVCQDNTCYAPADAPPRRPEQWFPPLSTPLE